MDSILVSSRQLLGLVRQATTAQKKSFETQEIKLLQIENEISGQINIILKTVEQAIAVQNQVRQIEREKLLEKTYTNVSWLAMIGLSLSLLFVLLVIVDFSKSQQYRKELEKANNQASSLLANREQLISTVSHDLKTPVSTINGYSEILSRSGLNPQHLFYVENIRKSSEYIQNLASDLASLTQLEAGKIGLEKQSFRLHRLLEETARSVSVLHPKKAIELLFDFDPALDTRIISDPYRIRQIAYNLIGNAYKFTEQGHIKLITKRIEDRVEVRFEDTGIGIAKESQEKIFETFTQADSTIEKRFGGTGLGLSISRKLAEILGGSLSVKSAPGKGSVFLLILPFEAGSEPVKTSNVTLSGKKAVVVDDDPSLLQLVGEVLRREGMSVKLFEVATDAIAQVDGGIDFVITDIQMPHRDGFWLKSEIKQRYPGLPVIALTGAAQLDKTDFLNAGFAGWVQKPFTASSLTDAIRRVVSQAETFIAVEARQASGDLEYDLESVKAFFVSEEDVTSFMQGIRQSVDSDLTKLKSAVSTGDVESVSRISHKMLSVFRQLHHRRIMEILEKLEVESDPTAIKHFVKELEANVRSFFENANPQSRNS